MKRLSRALALALWLVGGPLPAHEPDVIPHRQDRPPNPPYSPEEAVRRMTVPEGFTVELVASEPDLVNPVAMTFDDRGRIWIAESLEYPRRPAGPGRDRIKILEDTDGDGRADKVTVFADGLNLPTAIAVGHGGVWVVNAPDLLFFKEQDGREVSREVVLTGFGRTDTHELPNSLTWGPDGWLYGLNGVFNRSRVVAQGQTFEFTCALWRVHPRTREFQLFCEGTSNPWGLAWDTEGSALVSACHWANEHVFHFVETGYYKRQAGAYPPHTLQIGAISDHSHQKTAYCGLAYFDSDAYPAKYRERLYLGNIHGGCINVDVLRRDGSTYVSGGEPDFLTAHDAWFMPVAQKVGPDGCLYVLDWYDRYHCYQDANRDPAGIDRLRGRLYRVRYQQAPRAPRFDLAAESDDQLIGRLSSPNLYFREAAQRLLTERNTPSLRPRLQRLVLDEATPRKARLHALWALIGTGALPADFHGRLLTHPDPAVRAWGVRAAGNFRQVAPALRTKVAALARDPAPEVQLQVAIAARKLEDLDPLPVLADVLAHCGEDKLIPAIAWPNLHPLLPLQGSRFVRLVEQADLRSAPGLARLLPRAVERILSERRPDFESVVALVRLLLAHDPDRARESLAAVSGKVRELDEQGVGELKARLGPVLRKALAGPPGGGLSLSALLLAARLGLEGVDAAGVRARLLAPDQPAATRLQALEVLIAFKDPSLGDVVARVLASGPTPFLGQVLAVLGQWDDPQLADLVLARYPQMDPELQPLAIDLLMQREPWTRKLLRSVLDKKLPPGVLDTNHLRKILDGNDREAIWAVEKAWGTVRKERSPEREKVVAEMGAFLRQNPGDPAAGARVFKKLCAQCHVIYGEGAGVGPDLTANGRTSFEQLLSNVFDPSLVIGPGYQVTHVITKDGRYLTGLVVEDNDRRVVLKLPGGSQQAIARGNVSYTVTSSLSMMPEGIEQQLERRELADLVAFLALDRPPHDPRALPIPGAPGRPRDARVRVEKGDRRLTIRARLPGKEEWSELLTCVTDPTRRPYLHSVRDPSGRVVLTGAAGPRKDQPGIFTAYQEINGTDFWKGDQGRQHFVRLLDLNEGPDRASWKVLTRLLAPSGRCVLEEEQAVTVHAPETPERYAIDVEVRLRATGQEVTFGKAGLAGLVVQVPGDPTGPPPVAVNANGERGPSCAGRRAAWCAVEGTFGGEVCGIAIFDHPGNTGHPPLWQVDGTSLLSPNLAGPGQGSLDAAGERLFRYRLWVYRGSGSAATLGQAYKDFSAPREGSSSRGGSKP
jgi:putative heme-binding domain-containing protein